MGGWGCGGVDSETCVGNEEMDSSCPGEGRWTAEQSEVRIGEGSLPLPDDPRQHCVLGPHLQNLRDLCLTCTVSS